MLTRIRRRVGAVGQGGEERGDQGVDHGERQAEQTELHHRPGRTSCLVAFRFLAALGRGGLGRRQLRLVNLA